MHYEQTSNDITIRVEVDYVPPGDHGHGPGQYVWAYHITMRNEGDDVVRLKTRHWDIMDGNGRMHVVDGEGVVGETPVLKPNQSYSYSSGCPLPTESGSMSGWYMFERDDGQAIKVLVPAFSLDLPGAGRVLN